MQKYAIIIDEDNEKRVVPSNWMSADKSTLFWPSNSSIDIKKAIIECIPSTSDWESFEITKFIKFNDNYTNAIEEMKISGLEVLSDPNDEEKLRKSRNKRKPKIIDIFITPPVHKKSKRNENNKRISKDEDENTKAQKTNLEPKDYSQFQENDTSDEEVIVRNPIPPIGLNIIKEPAVLSAVVNDISHCADDNETVARVSNLSEASDWKNCNHSEQLNKILANQTKMYKQMHTVQIKQDILEKKFDSLKQQALKKIDMVSLSDHEIKTINKYFPINNNPEESEKKMDIVQEELKKKNFAKMLVTMTYC